MSPVGVEEPITTQYEEVTTKEELEALRKRLKKQRRDDTRSPIPGEPENESSSDWRDNITALVAFLTDLRTIMDYLIKERVSEDARELFRQYFDTAALRISIAIGALTLIDSEENELFVRLVDAELTGTPLLIKLREFWGGIGRRPVIAVLELADRILGSLFPILSELEPVKEFKEMLEERVKHGGDAGFQSLNLNGREQWWKKIA